jgi:hypothetical protein
VVSAARSRQTSILSSPIGSRLSVYYWRYIEISGRSLTVYELNRSQNRPDNRPEVVLARWRRRPKLTSATDSWLSISCLSYIDISCLFLPIHKLYIRKSLSSESAETIKNQIEKEKPVQNIDRE